MRVDPVPSNQADVVDPLRVREKASDQGAGAEHGAAGAERQCGAGARRRSAGLRGPSTGTEQSAAAERGAAGAECRRRAECGGGVWGRGGRVPGRSRARRGAAGYGLSKRKGEGIESDVRGLCGRDLNPDPMCLKPNKKPR
jgi:hypothetical protein